MNNYSSPVIYQKQGKKRDPQAHSVKKGNRCCFGYKAHIGVDSKTGLVHTVKGTAANVHDVTVMPDLLIEEETYVYGDSGYIGADKQENAVIKNRCGKKIQYKINKRPSQINKLSKEVQYCVKK